VKIGNLRFVAGGLVAFGGMTAFVACSFPGYFVPAEPAGDADVGDDVGPEDAGTPCEGGTVPVGRAVTCVCGLVRDSGLDGEVGDDAATTADAPTTDTADLGDGADAPAPATGYSACTNVGEFGACLGCPSDPGQRCEGATLPAFTTCVPAGIVTLGATNTSACPPGGCAIEGPEHMVALARYFLDDHEVTVRRFRDWWRNGHVTPKPGDVVFVAGDGTTVTWDASWVVREPTVYDGNNFANWLGVTQSTNDAYPVNFVDWPTALAYCVTNGGRLPTEAEWEAAASGRSGRIFPREAAETRNVAPLAAMLPCSHANTTIGAVGCGAPKASALDGFTVDGAYDMIGSVAEWVLDGAPHGGAGCTKGCYPDGPLADPLRAPIGAQRGVRGGSFRETKVERLRAQARSFSDATTQSADIGFRCVRR
jgi:formylglycine-generating enzyme required for sulfatase activity